MLRVIAQKEGAYVIGILDCSREEITDATALRGKTAKEADTVEPSPSDNFIFIYGSPKHKRAAEYSFIARTFFEKL